MSTCRSGARLAAIALCVALAALAATSCGRRGSPANSASATTTPAVPASPAPAPPDPGSPEVQALEKAATELDTLVAHVEAETAHLVKATDPTATDTTGLGPARLAWEAWGEPWVAKLAAIERALPPAPAPGEAPALMQAHRRLRIAFYELRMIPWVGPEQPLPLQADYTQHVSNARDALTATREFLAQARRESSGS